MSEPILVNVSQDEIDRRGSLVDACHHLQNSRVPVHIFADSPFYCRMAGIPIERMYEAPEHMIRAQILGWKGILEAVDCDIPRTPVMLDFGSCRTASSYGCRVLPQPGSVPGFEPWVASETDLLKLEKIDPCTTGMGGQAFEYYARYQELADDFPVRYGAGEPVYPVRRARLNTSSDGAFAIAAMIAGFDRVCIWCYDDPALLNRLLDIITEKEIERIRRSFETMGESAGPVGLIEDYCTYVSEDIHQQFILPHQQRLRDAFDGVYFFHACVADARFLEVWRDELDIGLLNGFKPQQGIANLKRDYQPVADALGGRVVIETDFDGANVMSCDEATLGRAARDFLEVFGDSKGVKLGATLCGGHRLDDLEKLNVLKQVVCAAAGGGR